jgi:hypothetical protein
MLAAALGNATLHGTISLNVNCASHGRPTRYSAGEGWRYSAARAPVAQWIEQRFPKPRALVRFRPGALARARFRSGIAPVASSGLKFPSTDGLPDGWRSPYVRTVQPTSHDIQSYALHEVEPRPRTALYPVKGIPRARSSRKESMLCRARTQGP